MQMSNTNKTTKYYMAIILYELQFNTYWNQACLLLAQYGSCQLCIPEMLSNVPAFLGHP